MEFSFYAYSKANCKQNRSKKAQDRHKKFLGVGLLKIKVCFKMPMLSSILLELLNLPFFICYDEIITASILSQEIKWNANFITKNFSVIFLTVLSFDMSFSNETENYLKVFAQLLWNGFTAYIELPIRALFDKKKVLISCHFDRH